MAETLPRPGVEIEQKFTSTSPTIRTPSLAACVVGRANYVVDAFKADGTLDGDAKHSTPYTNAALTVTQANFPDPRDIVENVNVDEDSIRVWVVQGSVAQEVLRTESFLAPTTPPVTGTLLDDGSPGTETKLFQVAAASAGILAADLAAGDRITIDGRFIRQVASAVDVGPNINITLSSGISKTLVSTSMTYFIIATSDLDNRSLTGLLTINLTGDAVIAANFLRNPDGTPQSAASTSAAVYIQYEALRLDLTANPPSGQPGFLTISDQDQLDAVLAPISTRNPLGAGVLFALINSPRTSVNALGVDEVSNSAPFGTLAGYNRALSFLEGKEVYALAPLTQDPVVHQAFDVHVKALSAASAKRERIAFVNQDQPDTEPDATQTSGNLANTITRTLILTNGFSTDEDFNARVESNIGSALTGSGLLPVGDLVLVQKLREADLYLQIAGGSEKFLIRTIVGPDLEIVNALASDAATATGPAIVADTPTRVASVFTFTGAGLIVKGVQVGDILHIINASGATGTGQSLDNTNHVISAVTATTITVETVLADGVNKDDDQLVTFEILPDTAVFTDDGFESTDPGSPFANQTWSIKTFGEALVISGTNPPIPDRDRIAETLGAIGATFGNRRLYYVQPDTVGTTALGTGQEELVPGFYLCAAIAGMVGEQPPQQGFTNFPVAGFTKLLNSNDVFSDTQIDVARAGGVYWVVQEAPGSAVVAVHQLSTDLTSIETRELSITKVVDFTAKFLRAGLRRFIGRFNITPEFLDQLSTIIQGLLSSLISQGVLNGAELKRIFVDENSPDTIFVEIVLDVPFPCNFIRLTLEV